ncbi:MAG: PIG-L family deacetylase [Chloroflexi bacterium]|nr:PIG-L family deacetylase [Chloroflexota bacterium]
MATVTILAIRPHPDDEVTGTGGILSHYARRGVPVGVLTCTGGEEGEIHDPDLDESEARPRLKEIREHELREACKVLGVSEVRLLGYRDSGMAGSESTKRPDAFCNAPLDEAGARVAAVIRELRPRIVITENQYGTYGHPDHVMCHKVAVRGVEMAADPQLRTEGLAPWRVERVYTNEIVMEGWEKLAAMIKAENLDPGWFAEREQEAPREPSEIERMAAKPWQMDAIIDVSESGPLIREALRKHRTQIPQDNFLLTWPDHILKEMFRNAHLRQVLPPSARKEGDPQLHDLLEGLRAAA